MGKIENEILIEAPIETIWDALAQTDKLDLFDPTVKTSIALSPEKTGLGASRKVDMADGKNWFEEKITTCKRNQNLEFELTDCSFPVNSLSHAYTFEHAGNQVKVKQVMSYQVKFGILGKIIDRLMMRKQMDKGIKEFMGGLKSYAETN